jgi:RNA polymerase II C-terminal domain phosphatase-like 3/4
MYTKLRPGVRRLLAACAPAFEMWIHTNGTVHYADAVVPLLDPDGAYFARRVLAQGGPRAAAAAETPDRPKALDRGLAGREAVALILDDTDAVRRVGREGGEASCRRSTSMHIHDIHAFSWKWIHDSL